MSMVEVDPKLFVTCRLCLEDSGTYQIVPSVQEKINYCYGIQVEPFDGLPQLICKKCQLYLVTYSAMKKKYVDKQEELKKGIVKNKSQQIEARKATPTHLLQNELKKVNPTISHNQRKASIQSTCSVNSRKSYDEVEVSSGSQSKNNLTTNNPNGNWELEYRKTFLCKICDLNWLTWASVMAHQAQHNAVRLKHANVLKKQCFVVLPKIDRNLNLTGSMDKVVYSKNRIIAKGTPDYLISYVYSGKNNNSSSDDENLNLKSNKRCKSDESSDSSSQNIARPKRRRRIWSNSSNETVVLENKCNASDREIVSDKKSPKENVCISIDDTDSDTENKKTQKAITIENRGNVKESSIRKLIASTLNKFNKKHENATKQPDSSRNLLRRKILSVGRKVINVRGFDSHRVLKYLEHANLNMIWLPRSPRHITSNTNFLKIAVRVINSSESNINDFEGFIKKYDKSDNEIQRTHIHTPNQTTLEKEGEYSSVTTERVSLESDAAGSRVVQGTSTVQTVLKGANAISANPQEMTVSASPQVHDSGLVQKLAAVEGLEILGQPHTAVQTVSNGIPHKSPFALSVTSESDTAMLYSTTAYDKKKLLNANPVANPKQLPKKFNSDTKLAKKGKLTRKMCSLEVNADDDSAAASGYKNDMPMPFITSTTSLAQTGTSANNNESSGINENRSDNSVSNASSENKNPTQMPRIKVKSVKELMSEETLSRMSHRTTTSTMSVVNRGPQTTSSSTTGVFGTSHTQNTLQPVITNVRSISSLDNLEDFVVLDTVELPNTKTASPFKYFKMLLQLHSMILLDNDANLDGDFHLLIRFKVQYKQDTLDQPVTLCLALFCSENVFCFETKDRNDDTIHMTKISANWQWQILKIYRGDVVAKLLSNAQNISQEVYDYTNRFLCLLKSINFVSQ